MKLDDILEQIAMSAATQSPDVKGLPKVYAPVVRRELNGYEEDSKKKKKRKFVHHRNPMHEEEVVAVSAQRCFSDDSKNTLLSKRVFAGERPKYKRKKNFFAKPTNIVKEQEEGLPMQQRPAIWDHDYLKKTFKGSRPKYKPKGPKIEGKKKVDEQFMGPQIFYNDSPYKDLEYLTKFFKGVRDSEKKSPKKNKKKAQGTYGPDE